MATFWQGSGRRLQGKCSTVVQPREGKIRTRVSTTQTDHDCALKWRATILERKGRPFKVAEGYRSPFKTVWIGCTGPTYGLMVC